MLLLSLVHWFQLSHISCVFHKKKCKAVPRLPSSHPSCHSLLCAMENRLCCCTSSETVVPCPIKSSKSQKSKIISQRRVLEPAGRLLVRADDGGVRPISIQIVFLFIGKSPRWLTAQTVLLPHLLCFTISAISYHHTLPISSESDKLISHHAFCCE